MKGKVIVITSGKGGVGKTTATASIGAALALMGKKTAVVDMDIGLRNLDVVMGLENRIVFNVVDAVKQKCKPSQVAIKDRRIDNLYLIPASQSDNKNTMNPDEVTAFISEIRNDYDFILIDCPAGIEQGFENAVAAADDAVVVCMPEVSSIRDADRIIGLLLAKEISPKLVVNRIVPQMVERGDMLSHEDVVDVLSIELLGLVEMDEQVIVSTNTGVPLVMQKESKAGRAFERIAGRLAGCTDLPIEVPRTDRGFFQRIGRKMGLAR
ncbi:site-determining protein [Desulfoluna limicola]|uniref:Septum site-determining protein MinD n=1 Tax=Desulfoluna limicola TaxID=2810562 RepID=A0ABM7PIP2_9BACT|nr:septum site-determining protein MinD [Desulfoluna limicola]BCS97168.1 site-determining protein [Desulfoluna limicola]